MTPSGRAIRFVKASACGNDFLIIDNVDAPEDIHGLSKRLCDRHLGVGADGVEWLFPAGDADVAARLINADGSEAEISGNGTRGVAAYLYSEKPRERLAIHTGAGVKICTLISNHGGHYEFEIDMGEPQIGEEFTVKLSSRGVRGIPVSMGNPHYVVFVEAFAERWQAEAAEIGRDATFKEGVNVELVRAKDENNIEVRFFERGVGETQSSGTGSCAAAVAAISAKRARSPVRVHAPGGVQTVRWEKQVFLRGATQLICRGEFFC
jgi:diaminopimelate epimerase